MKDNLSLIAAAAGGFILFLALSGILRGAPLVSSQSHSSFYPVGAGAAHKEGYAILNQEQVLSLPVNALKN